MENIDPTFTEQILYAVLFYAVIAIAGFVILLRDMRKDYEDDSDFKCYLCKGSYNRTGAPYLHYDKTEGEDDTVSLCDKCSDEVQERFKAKGLDGKVPPEFFNPTQEEVDPCEDGCQDKRENI